MPRPVCESGEVTPSKATLITLVAWPGCENLNGQVGLDWDGQKWTTDPLVTGPVTFSLVPLGNDQFRIDWDLGCDSGSESAGGSCEGLALLAVALVSPTCCTDPDPIGAVNMEISTGGGAPANAVPPVIPPPATWCVRRSAVPGRERRPDRPAFPAAVEMAAVEMAAVEMAAVEAAAPGENRAAECGVVVEGAVAAGFQAPVPVKGSAARPRAEGLAAAPAADREVAVAVDSYARPPCTACTRCIMGRANWR